MLETAESARIKLSKCAEVSNFILCVNLFIKIYLYNSDFVLKKPSYVSLYGQLSFKHLFQININRQCESNNTSHLKKEEEKMKKEKKN